MKGSKKLIGVVAMVLLIGASVSGMLMSMYIQQTSEIQADVVLTFDEVNAENLVITENFATVGGNTDTFIHEMIYSDVADDVLAVNFTISDTGIDDSTGIVFTVYENSTGSWEVLVSYDGDAIPQWAVYTFEPGEVLDIKTEYDCDTYLAAGNYAYTLDITREV